MTMLYFQSIEAVNDHIADLIRLREEMQLAGATRRRAEAENLPLGKGKIFWLKTRETEDPKRDLDSIALEAAQQIHTQSVAQIQVTIVEAIKRYFPGT